MQVTFTELYELVMIIISTLMLVSKLGKKK